MSQQKNFIITQDKTVSNILIAHGFHLLSNVCGIYTFMNEAKEKFDFNSIDTTKVYFTNKLNI